MCANRLIHLNPIALLCKLRFDCEKLKKKTKAVYSFRRFGNCCSRCCCWQLPPYMSSVYEVKFSPSEAHILATWDNSGEVRLWDALAGNCLHLFQSDNSGMSIGEENNINFSPDGKLLACKGSEVKVLRIDTGQLAAVCKLEGKMVCWNTRGNKLAVVTKKSKNKNDDGRDVVVFEM